MTFKQLDYLIAMADLTTIKKLLDAAETEYMERLAFTNEAGKPVTRIYQITWDDELFNNINEAFEREHKQLFIALEAAYADKADAENALIEYALSIAPECVRETLRQGIDRFDIRKQLLELSLSVDASTVLK